MITLHVANVTGSMDSLLARIKSAHQRAAKTAAGLLGMDNVDVVCVVDTSKVIKEIGVGGFTPNRHLTYLYIDPDFDVSESEIYATLCHELNHARRYDGEGYGKTLFDSMIFEGLATAFEAEASGGETFFTRELNARHQTEELISQTKQEFNSTAFNYSHWFIFDDSKHLPRWAGYEIGYYLVRQYMKKTNKKASELVLEASSSFNL